MEDWWWGIIMCPTLRDTEGETIMKFVSMAKCPYMSYCQITFAVLKDIWIMVDILVL